ncbi:UDP-N-acetylglucosamine 2-epimerase (non-hydrolyzing) [Candidatus Woesearchaeota archaeon]|nr:UDP-N-acetylglucosamine 2-epimerase (non-hydrolyzing) [Candidatus Woesearchaeota archaeon]
MKKILFIVGARPNFVKIAPLIRACKKYENINYLLVHTGQHYDKNISSDLFEDLEIPEPDYNLNVGGLTPAKQIGQTIIKLDDIILEHKPDLCVVVGDINSTLSAAICSLKNNVKIAHIEAGLRSFDKNMQEEHNRILVDNISDYLFVTEESGLINLKNETISPEKIFFVGNVMIDSLTHTIQKNNINLNNKQDYFVATIHRQENLKKEIFLKNMINAFNTISKDKKIILPLHPRTKKMLSELKLLSKFNNKIEIIDPMKYSEFISLIAKSKGVITDSGGIQEETSYLKIPCYTIRDSTERPITITKGTNILISDFDELLKKIKTPPKRGESIPLWDGNTAPKILEKINKLIQ